jgi:tetratricopeptide (TPR) repeat protein
MGNSSWITCLWPGLPRVWSHGSRVALLCSAAFALLLNSAVVVTFVWPEVVTPLTRLALWVAVAVLWLGAIGRFAWQRRYGSAHAHEAKDADQLFVQAQDESLRGDWCQAEQTLRKLLRTEPDDGEARLLLATLMKHTRRYGQAREELQRLERLEAADRLRLEIRREYDQLQRLEGSAGAADLNTGDDATAADTAGGQGLGASEAA